MKLPFLIFGALLLFACEKENVNCANPDFFSDVDERQFLMGFTTWQYAATNASFDDTYDFILNNGDVYGEQIDEYVPWSSWINGTDLSDDFLLKMEVKSLKKPADVPLSLSISFLDTDRSDLLPDQDGTRPDNSGFDDPIIIDAYEQHVKWLVEKFDPEYLVFAMEVNDLFIKDRNKWEEYKLFSAEMRLRIKRSFPELKLSESITLHSWFEPETEDVALYNSEMVSFLEGLDFASISFYAFLKGLSSKGDFQRAFDFLHEQVDLPIGMVETNHIAETLELESFDLTIKSDECEQKEFLESLLDNAQVHNYEFVIWWSHRDYDELWETFPDELKDIGKIWRDTGLLDEKGNEREAFQCWKKALEL